MIFFQYLSNCWDLVCAQSVNELDQVAHRPKHGLTELIAITMIKTRMKCATKI